jgi:EAL domain-containing protein (putative c-di-GMP-specific phosphodiesterase class I)
MSKAREFINALRDIGCRVALDDFGSGFSSFYYLKNLPIDTLKIDGGFVQQLCTNVEDRHVVRAMVELSRGFGIECTAEWVEDAETLELVRGFGVTYAQGFHIARPFRDRDQALRAQGGLIRPQQLAKALPPPRRSSRRVALARDLMMKQAAAREDAAAAQATCPALGEIELDIKDEVSGGKCHHEHHPWTS